MATKRNRNEPTLSIKRFRGLNTANERSQLEDEELTVATNLLFDDTGIVRGRGALRLAAIGEEIPSTVDDGEVPPELVASGVGYTFFMGIMRPSVPQFSPFWIFSCGDGNKGFPLSGNVDRQLLIGPGNKGEPPVDPPDGSPEIGRLFAPAENETQMDIDTLSTAMMRGVQYQDDFFMSDGKFITYTGEVWYNDAMPFFGTGDSRTACMEVHKERIFYSSKYHQTNPSRVFFCEIGDPTTWNADDFFDVGAGTGGVVTKLINYKDSLFIFKTDSIWVLYTSGTKSSWALRQLTATSCIGELAWEYEGALYWVGYNGVYRYDGSGVLRLSDSIQNFYDAGVIDGRQGAVLIDDTGPGFDFDLVAKGDICDDTIIFWILEPDHNKRIWAYSLRHAAWTELEFDFPTEKDSLNEAITDIFAVRAGRFPSTSGGIQNGFYFTVLNENGRFPAVYKLVREESVDQRVISSGVVVSATADTVTLDVELASDLTGKFISIYADEDNLPTPIFDPMDFVEPEGLNFDKEIESNTQGAGSVVTVTENWGEVPDTSNYWVIWEPISFGFTLKTKVWDFGNPVSAKRVKKLSLEVSNPPLTVNQIMNPDNVSEKVVTKAITENADLMTLSIPGFGKVRNYQIEITTDNSDDEPLALYGLHLFAEEHGRFLAPQSQPESM